MKQIRSWLLPIQEFYICGINVFDEPLSIETIDYAYKIEPEEQSDVDNSYAEFANVRSAKLSHYKIGEYDFYIAKSNVEKYFLVTLFAAEDSTIPQVDVETYESIEDYMLSQLKTDERSGVFYSDNKKHRAILEKREDGFIKCIIEKTCMDYWEIIDFPRYARDIYNNFFYFEYIRESIYDTMPNAIRSVKIELNDLDK